MSELTSQNNIVVDEIIEHSKKVGLTLPRSYIESVEKSLDSNDVSVENHIEFLNDVAERHKTKGFAWYVREDGDTKFPILYYIGKNQKLDAYVFERTNKETNEKFYVAHRINSSGKHFQMYLNNDLGSVKQNISAYYTSGTIHEIANERIQSLNLWEIPKTPSKVKTPEINNLELSM